MERSEKQVTGDEPNVDVEHGAALPLDMTSEKVDSGVVAMANEATATEHHLSTFQAFKVYRKAIAWSMFISLSLIMCGYDQTIIANFYALPAFRDRYGSVVPGQAAAGYQITAAWQIGLGMGSPAGQVIGGFGIGWFLDKYGRKWTFVGCLLLTTAFCFMQFFSGSLAVLTASEMLSGVVWGSYSVIGPTYASEVLPVNLRGFLTGYVNLCYVMGQLIGQGVTTGFDSRLDQWAYKIPFAIQWVWPVIMLSGMYWAPESPWWLIRQGHVEAAERSLRGLIIKKQDKVDVTKTLAMMIKTDAHERAVEDGSSYMDCFRGTNRLRTEIGIMVYIMQNFIGNPVGYATYFFEQVGLNTTQSFDMGVGVDALGFVGTCSTAVLLIYFGRRTAFIWGLGSLSVCLWIIAILDYGKNYTTDLGYQWGQAGLLLVVSFLGQATVNPVAYVIFSEISSARLRSKTIAICTTCYALVLLVIMILQPYLLNPGAINAGGKMEFLYGGLSLLSWFWCVWRIPETKGRTYEELDLMFERRVKTRDFKKYKFEDHYEDI